MEEHWSPAKKVLKKKESSLHGIWNAFLLGEAVCPGVSEKKTYGVTNYRHFKNDNNYDNILMYHPVEVYYEVCDFLPDATPRQTL